MSDSDSGKGHLILDRCDGETVAVLIDGIARLEIQVHHSRRGRTRLGLRGDPQVKIMRGELLAKSSPVDPSP